jgi:Asp-tRNA(Asn)/Glu-tRNA(Gln) amidotransferase A subunit family amidase
VRARALRVWCLAVAVGLAPLAQRVRSAETVDFQVMEATVDTVHQAYAQKRLTSRQLVQMYLDRIAAFDQRGPKINSIINLNPKALADADRLDAAYAKSGPVGPLHGIPVLIKDQADVAGLPTTLGSVLFKDFVPEKDSFVAARLKAAGAIILGKTTLGELGGGDTYGSLFGATSNPYALDRTPGGSSGGTAASITANFATIGVGQEGNSSIRRPSAWTSLVGMRPTAGLVSRSGVWGGWPSLYGSLGPMTRSVRDLAQLLDVMVGYDPEDPLTAYGVGHVPAKGYTSVLDRAGLKGARVGVIRESISYNAEPDTEDFRKVDRVFERAVGEMRAAGAVVIDNIIIPDLNALIAKRASGPDDAKAIDVYLARNASSPFKSRAELYTPANLARVGAHKQMSRERLDQTPAEVAAAAEKHYQSLVARDQLLHNILKVMADNNLDAIVHKSVEHSPTLIKDGINPPYQNHKGVITINTTTVFASSMSVPAGFTEDGLPVGITLLGRPYAEPVLLKLAYAYEQATRHRKPPPTTPALTAR